MEAALNDLWQAQRALRKSPVLAATVVLTLALAIGANSAIFSVANSTRDLVRSTLTRIRAIPGVEAAGATCRVPLQRSWGETFKIVGRDDGGRPFTSGADVCSLRFCMA